MNTINTRGYSDDENGFSGAFSWWRSETSAPLWAVCCFEDSFCKSTLSYAVTDDFGNLVRVSA